MVWWEYYMAGWCRQAGGLVLVERDRATSGIPEREKGVALRISLVAGAVSVHALYEKLAASL